MHFNTISYLCTIFLCFDQDIIIERYPLTSSSELDNSMSRLSSRFSFPASHPLCRVLRPLKFRSPNSGSGKDYIIHLVRKLILYLVIFNDDMKRFWKCPLSNTDVVSGSATLVVGGNLLYLPARVWVWAGHPWATTCDLLPRRHAGPHPHHTDGRHAGGPQDLCSG